ncbi:MAG TPA: flavin reductase family protein [Dictyobacter sp.]|jgi:3-hydroxy-9,10-secoandrosta-1,3,5(10)-triene-9,17-dione monooxygenase reductase component|nr:flavin reductase family protein [Dictyobacter sp.]
MTTYDYSSKINIHQTMKTALSEPEAAIDSMQYQHIMGYYATGIAIITTLHQQQSIGFTVDSFCSVSSEPALISFCTDSHASVRSLLDETTNFCVNILSDKQKAIFPVFAKAGGTRFHATEYYRTTSNIPVLAGALAWLECSVLAIHPAGNRNLILGRVHNMKIISDDKPLIYYKGHFGTFTH